MAEKFHAHGSNASGTNIGLWNLFNPAAAPTSRGKIYDMTIGAVATPADQAVRFQIGRTTAVGTEDAGFTPVNLDSGGPAGAYDAGIGFSGGQPTKTANKELLTVSLNQRATFRWVASPSGELLLAATQNNGAVLNSLSSTSTQAHQSSVFFEE